MIHLVHPVSGVSKLDLNLPYTRLIGELTRPDVTGVGNMQSFIHWFATNGNVLAVLVTAGVAVLLVCCLGCSNCPSRDKDDLFRSRNL